MYTFSTLTASDSCSKGEKEDKSGDRIIDTLKELGWNLVQRELVPDVKEKIKDTMLQMIDKAPHLLITTGGTGLFPRDVTPEATRMVIKRDVPGISEAIRLYGMQKTPFSMLSRGMSGIRDKTLIINLPGSPKAVQESLEVIIPILPHALDKLRGDTKPCGRK